MHDSQPNFPTSPDLRPPSHLYIVGCGYSGESMGRWARQQGCHVIVTTRRTQRAAELAKWGFDALTWDPAGSEAPGQRVPASTDAWGAISFPPGPDAAMSNSLDWLSRQGVERIVYLSATSVYGMCDGAWVDEDAPLRADSQRGAARIHAEQSFAAGCEARGLVPLILRLPGIHGPWRTLRDRMRAGQWVILEDGTTWSNRIHVDDIATAAATVLGSSVSGGVWNACDNEPFAMRTLAAWMASALQLPYPRSVTIDEIPESMRDFWLGNRRCSNARLRALGWEPRYPDFRAALLAAWRVEDGMTSPTQEG